MTSSIIASRRVVRLAATKRPAEELFDIVKDPGCLTNLAGNPEFEQTKKDLSARMTDYLKQTGDPRVLGNGDIWDIYQRYSNIRRFPPP